MLILDSHTFLWLQSSHDRLQSEARDILVAHKGPLAISMASVWEIEIKQASGKLEFARIDWSSRLLSDWLVIQNITLEDTLRAAHLPLIHRDPFDRMIIAQALNRQARVVTRDTVFTAYGAKVVAA